MAKLPKLPLLLIALAAQAAAPDQQLWQEYGLQKEETLGAVKTWRFQDSTGALGALLSVPSMMARQHYNYVLDFGDHQPTDAEMLQVVSTLKNIDSAPLPSLPSYLPQNPSDKSQRYITGPVALARFAPQIPPGVAAFHYGAEATLAKYGDTTVIIFEYPTQPIARQRIEEFRKLPGITAKRTGPLIAAVINPKNADEAELLLSKVRYAANLTMDEYVPTRRDNIGHLVITAFELIGFLLIFSAVAGLSFGGWRVFRRKRGIDPDAMITLHLADRS